MNADNIRIVKHIGTISCNSTGMMKELNIVSIDGGDMIYDLREWSVDHGSCGAGISFENDEAKRLAAILSSCLGGETTPAEGDELVSLLNRKNISFVDKRSAGGALWVIGGHEFDSVMAECEVLGFKFQYSEKGGKQTRNQPGWYFRTR